MRSANFFPSLHDDVVMTPGGAREPPSSLAAGMVLHTFRTLAGGGWVGGGRGNTAVLVLPASEGGSAALVDNGRLWGPPVPSRVGLLRGGTGAEVDLVDERRGGGGATAAVGTELMGFFEVLKPM